MMPSTPGWGSAVQRNERSKAGEQRGYDQREPERKALRVDVLVEGVLDQP